MAWLLLVLALLLVAACALFVAAEFSFVTVDRASVDRLADDGDTRAKGLQEGLASLSTQLSGAQLGITVTSLVIGFIAEPSIATLLRPPLSSFGWSESTVSAVAVALALIIATGVSMVLGELVPKNWAISEPMRVGRAVQGAMRGFTRAARPIINLLNGSANAVLGWFGIEAKEELASARSPEELASLVERSAEQGTLDEQTADLVTRSIVFSRLTAEDVMTARPRLVFAHADQSAAELLRLSRSSGHARFPVAGEGMDDVIGMVHFKDALRIPRPERASTSVATIMHPVLAVPEALELDALMDALRADPLAAALVVDEYGGTAGVVTLENLVEEIIGEIHDEQDLPRDEVLQRADGSWLLAGRLRPDEVSAALAVDLPEGLATETLAGLLIERLGRMPQVGDSVTVATEHGSRAVRLTVTRLDGRRVDRIVAVVADAGSPT